MTNLLIHSMAEFSETILACLSLADAREVVEIGAEFGGMSQRLVTHLEAVDGKLTSVDPKPATRFTDWAAGCSTVRHIAAPSLEALPTLAAIDAWLIDGDHNYYTVRHELTAIDRLSIRDGKPLLAILHDVGWPWGRRDLYYAPERIPPTARHLYSYDAGIGYDDAQLIPGGGFRGEGQFAIARKAGGARSVLTAVEDFLVDIRADGREVAFAMIPGVFGLGVVFAAEAPWSGAVAALLHPLHANPLLAKLEENRLRNYLAVIDWQDRAAREATAKAA